LTFDPDEMLRVLGAHGVTFVLIGGLAAAMHGADGVTVDLDITPSRSRANLRALSAALAELDARIRVDGIDAGLPFDHDAASLARASVWSLRTRAGDLDIAFEPTGTAGYDDLAASALLVQISGVDVRLASLADVIRSKEAADRPKDRLALPGLRELARRAFDH
jgi:hypothetical protein